MATGQDSQHDFAPAWLKLPNQDALKTSSVRFGGRSFDGHSVAERSSHNGWYSGMRGTMEDLSAYTRYPRRQRFYSTDHHSDYGGTLSADGQRHYMRHGTRPTRQHDQLNGSLSDPYHVNGLRSPVTNTSVSSKKLHQHADAHGTAGATEFTRNASKKSDSNRNRKNAVVSLEDDFPSLNGDMKTDRPLFSKVLSVWDSPGRDGNVISNSNVRSQSVTAPVTAATSNTEGGHKALVLKTGGAAKRLGGEADRSTAATTGSVSVSSNGLKQTASTLPNRDTTHVSTEVLGACLVTQPRKLADKKSSFLRALRREASDEPNIESPVTSPPLPITTDSIDKEYAVNASNDEVNSVTTFDNPGDENSVDSSTADEVFPSEAEERLLRAMGWRETDDDNDGYEITEDDVKQFEDLCRQMKLNKVNEERHCNGFATDVLSKLKCSSTGSAEAPYMRPYVDDMSDLR